MSPIYVDPNVANPTPPEVIVSPDGILTATVHEVGGGVFLEADFTASIPTPVWVRFERDGKPIFSGDAAAAPGGYGVAYDMFAPLGVPVTYRAIPIFYDGTEGSPSEAVSVVLPDLDCTADLWIKPALAAHLSMRLSLYVPNPELGDLPYLTLDHVPGSDRLSGSWDTRTPSPVQMVIQTDTYAERDQLKAALDCGPVLVQAQRAYGIDDFWALPDERQEVVVTEATSPERDNVVTFIPCAEPSTVDTPLVVPGRSWQWATDTHTWNSLNATFDSWLSVVTPT